MNPRIVLSMIRLRLLRILREPSSLVWLILMPMVFSLLMGQLLGDMGGSGKPTRYSVLVHDVGGGSTVDRLLAPLRSDEQFLVVPADSTLTREQARRLVEERRITAALFVPAGFSAAVEAGSGSDLVLYYDSDRLGSQTVRTLLDESLLKVNVLAGARTLVAPPGPQGPPPRGHSVSFDQEVFTAHWENPRLRLEVATLGRLEAEGPPLVSAAQHVGPSYTLFFVMMFLMMSAKDLVNERQDRTLARLMTSRASNLDLVLGFFLGGLVLGVIQSAVLLGLNMVPWFGGLDYGDSPLSLALAVFLFAAFCSATSVLLGSTARSGAQADGLGLAATLVAAALGGLWWPLEIVPDFMQVIGRSLPTGQAITIFHDLIGRGYGLVELTGLLLGLLLWFAVVFVLSVWRLRRLVAV